MNRNQKIDELMTAFSHLKRHMKREISGKVDDGMTVTQIELLIAIEKGFTRLRDIATFAYMTPSAVTQQLKVLEAARLIERHESPQDRRENTLVVTKKGKAYLTKRKAIIHEHFRNYLSNLSDRELETFIKIMNKMTNNT